MSVHLAKRVACDRCREQKVRCHRGGLSNGACARCLRIGASCLISSAKPLGRPRTVPDYSRHNDGDNPRSIPSDYNGDQRQQDSALSLERTEKNLSQPANPLSWPALGDPSDLLSSTNTSNLSFDDMVSWSPVENCNFSPLPPGRDEDVFLGYSAGLQEPNMTARAPRICLDARALSDSTIVRELNSSGEGDRPDLSGDPLVSDHLECRTGDEHPRHGPGTSHTVLWLARLNGDIARHLADVSSYPWQADSLRNVCLNKIQQGNIASPLAPILQSTTEFLTCLQILRVSSSSSASPSSQWRTLSATGFPNVLSPPPRTNALPPEMSVSSPSLDIPTVLLLLASHLQLIDLYDAIFYRAYVSMHEMTPESIDSYIPIPGLELGGFPIMQGQLQIKIVIQTVEHQLEQIERCIGLPTEYCISGQQDSYQGILSNLESSMLLQAIMKQMGGHHGNAGGVRVASLKRNIDKVQKLLAR